MSARPTVTVLICVAAASCAAGAYVIATRAAGGIRRRKPKRVGIFGLSANPPTNLQGHAGVVAHFLGTTLDEVWVLPVYKHIYASKHNLAPFDDRVRMCQLTFEGLDGGSGRVKVVETERVVVEAALRGALLRGERPEGVRVGSIDVVGALRAQHPGVDFHWILGEDTFRDLKAGMWKESKRFLETVTVLPVRRAGVASSSEGSDELITVPSLGPISSTEVRAAIKAGDYALAAAALHPDVLRYISQRGLYSVEDR